MHYLYNSGHQELTKGLHREKKSNKLEKEQKKIDIRFFSINVATQK